MSRISNSKILVLGNNCVLKIVGGDTIVRNTTFWIEDDDSVIVIGHDFTMEGGHIASTEGSSIIIGDDCMFSGDVEIKNGDSHSIIDAKTKTRINRAKDVIVGNHVWLTAHVRILKGSIIPNNTIIGNSSIISTTLFDENCIYGGMPQKVIREGVCWDRSRKL